jgi:phage tail protein X
MNRYRNIPILKDNTGNRYYKTTIYPDIPLQQTDVYVYTTQGDRYDILAAQYYGDSSLWWIIATANPEIPKNSLFPPEGIQIRIPSNPSDIISLYETLNEIE